jgi:hypothetical protein
VVIGVCSAGIGVWGVGIGVGGLGIGIWGRRITSQGSWFERVNLREFWV